MIREEDDKGNGLPIVVGRFTPDEEYFFVSKLIFMYLRSIYGGGPVIVLANKFKKHECNKETIKEVKEDKKK